MSMQGRGQYWWMSLLTACIGMLHTCFMHCSISIGAMHLPFEVAYMCVYLCRKNACSRCSKDTNRVCDCGVDAMPMLNTDDSLGSSLNCRPSTLPGLRMTYPILV